MTLIQPSCIGHSLPKRVPEADALDPYASALQALDLQSRKADTDWRRADTRRITDALNLVQGARSNDDKIDAWTKVFPRGARHPGCSGRRGNQR